MKFLLAAVNAKYIHSNPAVYSLRAFAGEKLGKSVEIAEYTINQYPEEILADIYQRKPDAVGFSCYIWNWRLVQELIAELPKVLPETDLWLGGPEVSFTPEQILKQYPSLKGIMTGEGEETFSRVLQAYVREENREGRAQECVRESGQCSRAVRQTKGERESLQEALLQIAGLCLPAGRTAERAPVDLNEVPFWYDDLQRFENKIIYYESSRGCPYRCSYCLSSIDKRVRLRSIDTVKKELQFFLDSRVPQVKFIDRTFNCVHDHAQEIWKYLLEHDNGVTNFHFEIAADILQEEELALLGRMRPGLVRLEIGVQSVNPRTLQAIRRTMDVEKLQNIVAAIRRGKNVHQHLDLIAGLPYEDYESFGHSFNTVYAMRPQQLQLGFLKVLKGSEMYERAEEFGISYRSEPPYEVLSTRWLSYAEVLRLKRIEQLVEIYYNSSQFTHTLPFLERAFSTPFAMFEVMADFFEKRGCFVNSPARSHRYQILLDFALEYDGRHAEIYRELLIFDLYLRENLKSRPAFAGELSQYKEEIRSFYQREEQERSFLPGYKDYDHRQLARMTHLEPFFYPVWDNGLLQEMVQAEGQGEPLHHQYVLFDYHSRSPLTYEAGSCVVPVGETQSRKSDGGEGTEETED